MGKQQGWMFHIHCYIDILSWKLFCSLKYISYIVYLDSTFKELILHLRYTNELSTVNNVSLMQQGSTQKLRW